MWKYPGRVAVVLIVSTGAIKTIQAQDSLSGTVRWDFQTCLDYAHKNNLQVQSLEQTKLSADQDLLLAKAARWPNLTGSVSQTVVKSKKNTNPVIGGFTTQASFSSNYSINSSVTLFNGGYINNNIKQQGVNVQIASLNIDVTQNDIILQITQAFLNILLVKENIIYLQDALNTSQAQLKQGKQQFDAGSLSKKDYIQFESLVATDNYNLITAHNSYRTNLMVLKQILQLTSAVDFDIVAPDTLGVKKVAASLQTAEEIAMATRPEIKSSELSIDVAKYELKKAKAARWPTVSLSAALSSGYSNNQTDAYFIQLDNNFYQRAGLSIAIPIFNNRIIKTAIEQAKIQIEQARISLLGTKMTLDQAVEQSYIAVLNAQSQFDAAGVQFQTNEETYDITNKQLQLGAINMVELLQQKTLYIQALQAYIQAKYSVILNQKVFDFYKGIPVTL